MLLPARWLSQRRDVLRESTWMPGLFVALIMAVLAGCAKDPDLGLDSYQVLYLEVFSAYEPLSQCVREQLDAGTLDVDSWIEWLIASGKSGEFEREAARLLSSEEALLELANQMPNETSRLALLAGGLGAFGGAAPESDNTRMTLRRMNAIVLAISSMAEATQGICSPSDELRNWAGRARDADH